MVVGYLWTRTHRQSVHSIDYLVEAALFLSVGSPACRYCVDKLTLSDSVGQRLGRKNMVHVRGSFLSLELALNGKVFI